MQGNLATIVVASLIGGCDGSDDDAGPLDADNGDAATFRLDVTEDGTTTSHTVPWSTCFDFDRFEIADIDLGF